MYAPPAFHVTDQAVLHELISAHPLAVLVKSGQAGPVVAHIPLSASLTQDGNSILTGHVARANPFWKDADGASVVAVFTGPDAYISPGYYPSKQEHGKVVPTWNYVRVEARGVLRVQSDPEHVRPYVDAPTTQQEAFRNQPWSTADAPPTYIDKLSRAIVGLRVDVEQLDGVWKLSQNKSQTDFQGVVGGLEQEGHTPVATMMSNIAPAAE